MATKIPKWLKKGERLMTVEHWIVMTVMDNGWVWMRNGAGKRIDCHHVREFGKNFKRAPMAKRATRGVRR
jgi:hypothetical protein